MPRVRRFFAVFLVGILVIVMLACSAGEVDEEVVEENNNLIVVGFSQPGAESAWRVALTDSVKDAFSEENGYKLIYKDGQSKQDNQIRDIRTFIQQGVDYIILCPIVETGWDTVLEEAKQAGIPVIVCDRNVTADNSLYKAFVGSNFSAEGDAAIHYLEEKYGPDENGEEPEVNIVHIQGTIGSSAQLGRTQALEEALATHENWHLVAQECGEFTKAKSRELMTDVLKTVPADSIDVLYCENDEEALGAIQALNDAHVPYGDEITIISFDGSRNALELCKKGEINLVVECNPLQGPYLYSIISMINDGVGVPKITYIDEKYFTPEDLTEDFIENRKY
ncbi:MAG: ABC transporter substrate-binding protein [Pseudobutyrivibrio sp.]|nr:ABC transporter substrate-binding protein [Pseudobutyrivibrio sp.]